MLEPEKIPNIGAFSVYSVTGWKQLSLQGETPKPGSKTCSLASLLHKPGHCSLLHGTNEKCCVPLQWTS